VRQQERRLRERNAAASTAGSPTPGEVWRHRGNIAAASAAGSPPLGAVQPRDEVGAAASAAGSRTPPGDAVTSELLEQLRGESNDILLQPNARDTQPATPPTGRPARNIRRPARFNDFYV